MPFHLSTPNKGNPRALAGKTALNKSASVNKTATFGLGPGQWKIRDEKHAASLLENLRALRDQKEFTDMTISYDKENIHANRVVLAAVSPVMRNVFTKHENLMNAEILPPEALHHLVLFIYNASTEVKFDVIKKIEKASRVLQMHPVTTMCSNLLSTMPEFADNDKSTMKRRRQAIPRGRIAESTGEPSLPPQPPLSENKISSADGGEGGFISAAAISEILVDNMKKGNRASIRLTFHSRGGTPLSRSTEDLSQTADATSTDSLDAHSVDSKDKSTESDSSQDKTESTLLSKPSKPAKTAEEKRNQFKLSKLTISSFKTSKTDLGVPKNKPAIPLSKLLQESKIGGSNNNSNLINSNNPSLKSLQNLTWPKRAPNSPKRKNIPADWRQTTACHVTSSEPMRKDQIENPSSTEKKQKISEMRSTRDKFIIGFKSKSFPNLLKGLNTLREQNLFCDLIIVVGGSKIPCHKVILAASSEIFGAVLKKVTTREIELTRIDESAIQEMVKFIYTGQCTIDKENVMGVIRGSRRFHLHFVARKCASFLDQYVTSSQSFFTIDNVLVTYKAAGEYGFPKLKEECKKFAATRFWELIETQCFKDLSFLELTWLLSNEALLRTSRLRDCDQELQLFRGLLHWLLHSPQTRIPHMTSRVMKFVDFKNMTHQALTRVVAKETIIMQNPEMRERFLQIFRENTSKSRRSQSEQLTRSPITDSNLCGDNVLAVALENDTETGEPINRIYNLTHLDENRRFVTSSPVLWNGHAVTSLNGSLYVAGGRDIKKTKRIYNEVYRFNPSEGWSQLPTMKIPRSHFAIVSLNGAIYAIGGLSENEDSQYIATESCEKLEQISNSFTWTSTTWSLPGPSYSHATTCIVTKQTSNANAPTNKVETAESKRKVTVSPKKKVNRLSAAFTNDGKPTLLNRGSPKPPLKNKKLQATESLQLTDSDGLIFVCGGKANPRQNIVIQALENNSKFIERAPLPCPCTKLSMSSHGTNVYIACDDVMEALQFRVIKYSLEADQWNEIRLPVMVESPHLACPNIDVLSTKEEHPHHATINCASVATGIILATGFRDVITTGHLDVTSSKWTSYEQTKLKSPSNDFQLCTV